MAVECQKRLINMDKDNIMKSLFGGIHSIPEQMAASNLVQVFIGLAVFNMLIEKMEKEVDGVNKVNMLIEEWKKHIENDYSLFLKAHESLLKNPQCGIKKEDIGSTAELHQSLDSIIYLAENMLKDILGMKS